MERQDKLAELQNAMDQAKDRRHFERYQAVQLHLDGYTLVEIGRVIRRRPETVSA